MQGVVDQTPSKLQGIHIVTDRYEDPGTPGLNLGAGLISFR